MLVMRRRAGEKLLIGDQIQIEVLEIAGTRVKLGIVAPESVAIVRQEAESTRTENVEAARSAQSDTIVSLLRSISSVNTSSVNNLTGPESSKNIRSSCP